MNQKFETIDQYLSFVPEKVRPILETLRREIKALVPEAEETISYQLPTFKIKGKNLVHFAGWENHIGFYPTPSGTEKFQKELAKYKGGKGSVRFPLDQPLPMELIKEIVKFRSQEIMNTKD